MKKLLGILVLGLLWCNVGVAETISIICRAVEFPELKESMEFKKKFNKWTVEYSSDDESGTYIEDKKDEDGGVSKLFNIIFNSLISELLSIISWDNLGGILNLLLLFIISFSNLSLYEEINFFDNRMSCLFKI